MAPVDATKVLEIKLVANSVNKPNSPQMPKKFIRIRQPTTPTITEPDRAKNHVKPESISFKSMEIRLKS